MKLVVITLTFNEERHLARCIASVQTIASAIVVADCFSTDATLEIVRGHGARVIQREWVNYATQFNWALTQLDADTDWVLRLDADEVLTPELVAEIQARLSAIDPEIDGVYCSRRMTFQGRLIRHGGVFPVRVLRLFRYGRGQCENRWMDEHIKVAGATADFTGELIDDNLQSLTWWTAKHNSYASREAVDLLNLEYHFMPHDSVARLRGGKQAGVKALVEGTGLRPPARRLPRLRLFLLPLRHPPGVPGRPGWHGIPLSAGLLVSVSGGRQGGRGQAVDAGNGMPRWWKPSSSVLEITGSRNNPKRHDGR